ncbi:hypothetical protein BJ741DRAFT_628567 [Chytriomyces cf. hyalinus JEL632]|nr:hypothetical protein BJ741DRAFT_628567 [Chytriomyces cf. hyalinus JEL632]
MDTFNDYLANEGFMNLQHSVDLEASLLESFAEEVLDLTHDTNALQDNTIMCFPPFNSSLSLPKFDDSHSAFFVEPFQPVVVGIPNDFQMPSSFPFSHQPFQPLYHHQQTHHIHHQQYQEQGFNSVSPSPSLESPYSLLHGYSSSTPPHTPTCLPLSIVAPSSTPMFYLDTHCVRSSPAPLESTTTATTAVQPVKITIPSTRSMHFSPLPTPVQRSPLSGFISTTHLLATEKRDASPFVESPRCESVEPASPSASLPEITLPSTTTATTSTRKPKPSKSASTHSDSVYSPRKSSTTSKRSLTQQSSNAAAAATSSSTMGVKKRHILKERETKLLNVVFESTRFLQASQAAELAAKMGMTVTQIRIWFQNKRAFVKRQSSALSLQSDD